MHQNASFRIRKVGSRKLLLESALENFYAQDLKTVQLFLTRNSIESNMSRSKDDLINHCNINRLSA